MYTMHTLSVNSLSLSIALITVFICLGMFDSEKHERFQWLALMFTGCASMACLVFSVITGMLA